MLTLLCLTFKLVSNVFCLRWTAGACPIDGCSVFRLLSFGIPDRCFVSVDMLTYILGHILLLGSWWAHLVWSSPAQVLGVI